MHVHPLPQRTRDLSVLGMLYPRQTRVSHTSAKRQINNKEQALDAQLDVFSPCGLHKGALALFVQSSTALGYREQE